METAPPIKEERNQAWFQQRFWIIVGLLLAVHVLIVGAIAIFFQPSVDPIILRYNVFFGIDILAAWWQVYFLPLLSFSFVVANIFLSYRLRARGDWLLATLLLLGSGVVVFGLSVAIATIVFINY